MNQPVYYSRLVSPVGELLLVSDGTALTAVSIEPHDCDPEAEPGWRRDDALLAGARKQLWAYFAGELFDFDLALAPKGTDFQRRVWAELRRVPFGRTASYAELARRVGQPGAARAVGSANRCNPLAVIVPCHRIIAADGTLGGYAGGLDRKRWLLRHEADVLARRPG